MGYLHINNLYKDQRVMMFKECYALEKIHGTSAHVGWSDGQLAFYAGGEKHDNFVKLFDQEKLAAAFNAMGHPRVVVHGEAYGGKQQKQSWRYGPNLRFVAFDVRIGDSWLDVPDAHDVVTKLGLEFVHYERIPCDLSRIDAERDAPSAQAKRNGVEGDKPREGVVLRPLNETTDKRGERIICKHKRDEERETTTPRQVVDPEKLAVLTNAAKIADEWVTETRMQHVLDKLGNVGIEDMRKIIGAMQEDVTREGAGELVVSKEAQAAIGRRTAMLYKRLMQEKLREVA